MYHIAQTPAGSAPAGYIVIGPSGALLRDGGAGQYGEPLVWHDRARAAAKAEWLNLPERMLMTAGERRTARQAIGARHGLSYDVVRGLLSEVL